MSGLAVGLNNFMLTFMLRFKMMAMQNVYKYKRFVMSSLKSLSIIYL